MYSVDGRLTLGASTCSDQPHSHVHTRYLYIAKNYRWYKLSYIWEKNPQNKCMPELQDHAHAAHLWPTAWHGDLTPGGLWAFLASISIVQLIKSLWVGPSKIWQNTSYLYSIFTVYGEVKVHAKMFDHSNFHSFYLVCRTHMQNMHKLAPCKNFPLYGN